MECDVNGDVGKDDGKRHDAVDLYKEKDRIDDSSVEKLSW